MARRTHALVLLMAGLGCALDVRDTGRVLFRVTSAAGPALIDEPLADLASPERLAAMSGELRAIPLFWEPLLVGDVAGYAVERSLLRDGPFDRLAVVRGRIGSHWIDRGEVGATSPATPDAPAQATLRDAMTLYYWIRAFTPLGHQSPPSPVVAATTAPAPPAPENLRAYSHQPRQVPLSWRASKDPNVAGTVVLRSPTATGPFEEITHIDGRYETRYVDRNLGDLRVFHYRVAFRNSAGGEGEPSAAVRAVTKSEPLPPFGVRVDARKLGMNRLAWETNVEPDVVEYRLFRKRDAGAPPELTAVLPAHQTVVEDTAVAADEQITYTLVAVDRDGLESPPSHPLRVESLGYELSARLEGRSVRLDWNPHFDGGYRGVQILRRGRLGYSPMGEAGAPPFVDGSVESGRTYEYRVILQQIDGTPAPQSSSVTIAIP